MSRPYETSHIRYASVYPLSKRSREIKSYEIQTYEPYDHYDDYHRGYRGRRSADPDGSVRITKSSSIPFHGHTTIRDYSPRPIRPALKRPYTNSESSHDYTTSSLRYPSPIRRIEHKDTTYSSHGILDRPPIPYYGSRGISAHRRSSSVSDTHPVRRNGVPDPPYGRRGFFDYTPAERSSRPRVEVVYNRDGTRSPSRERIYDIEHVPRGRRRDSYREKDEDVRVHEYEHDYLERGRSRQRRRESPSWGRAYEHISRGGEERPWEVVNYTHTKETVTDFVEGHRERRGRWSSRDEGGLFQKGDRVVSRYDFSDLGLMDRDLTVRFHR
jgi:hypothetical protein